MILRVFLCERFFYFYFVISVFTALDEKEFQKQIVTQSNLEFYFETCEQLAFWFNASSMTQSMMICSHVINRMKVNCRKIVTLVISLQCNSTELALYKPC